MKRNMVSVIIPVYNTQEYISECLKSVIRQSYTNLEIIIVNDGATDGSMEIVRNHAKKDSRIKIINQSNKGLAAARNSGIRHASGDWLFFLDSDDYIADDAIETLLSNALSSHSDMVLSGYLRFTDDGNKQKIPVPEITITGSKKINEFFINGKNKYNYVWSKLYSKNVFSRIQFPVDKNYEDDYTIDRISNSVTRFTTVNRPLYYYRQRKTSITHTPNAKNITDKMNANLYRIAYISTKHPEFEAQVRDNALESMCGILIQNRFLRNNGKLWKDYIRTFRSIKKNAELSTIYLKIAAFLFSISPSLFASCYTTYFKIRYGNRQY